MKKILRLALTTIPVIALLESVLFISPASAGSLTSVSDAMSRLKTGASATHTITFTLASTLQSTSRVKVTTANFSFGTLTPSYNASGSTGSCSATFGVFNGSSPFVSTLTSVTSCDAGDNLSFIIPASTNPAAAVDTLTIETDLNNDGTYEDSSNVAVDVLTEDQVSVSATISASYTFTVSAKTSGTIDSVNCQTTGTTASSINFNNGTALSTATRYQACQTLTVSTNAANGHQTYVRESALLTNGTSNTILSFVDGTPPAVNSEATWASPTGKGHFGFTTTDTVTGSTFSGGTKFAGFTGTTNYKIFDASGPVNGTGAGGTADIGYDLEVNGTQEAGTYTNTLTYTSSGIF